MLKRGESPAVSTRGELTVSCLASSSSTFGAVINIFSLLSGGQRLFADWLLDYTPGFSGDISAD